VVERNIDADVVACLERITAVRGAPAFVRFNHAPAFIANAVADWDRLHRPRITPIIRPMGSAAIHTVRFNCLISPMNIHPRLGALTP
jgi:hypothetical protein